VWRVGAESAAGPEHGAQLWQVSLLLIAKRPRLHFLILLGNQTTLTVTYVPTGSVKIIQNQNRDQKTTANLLMVKHHFSPLVFKCTASFNIKLQQNTGIGLFLHLS